MGPNDKISTLRQALRVVRYAKAKTISVCGHGGGIPVQLFKAETMIEQRMKAEAARIPQCDSRRHFPDVLNAEGEICLCGKMARQGDKWTEMEEE